jgi:hypothetical protein
MENGVGQEKQALLAASGGAPAAPGAAPAHAQAGGGGGATRTMLLLMLTAAAVGGGAFMLGQQLAPCALEAGPPIPGTAIEPWRPPSGKCRHDWVSVIEEGTSAKVPPQLNLPQMLWIASAVRSARPHAAPSDFLVFGLGHGARAARAGAAGAVAGGFGVQSQGGARRSALPTPLLLPQPLNPPTRPSPAPPRLCHLGGRQLRRHDGIPGEPPVLDRRRHRQGARPDGAPRRLQLQYGRA